MPITSADKRAVTAVHVCMIFCTCTRRYAGDLYARTHKNALSHTHAHTHARTGAIYMNACIQMRTGTPHTQEPNTHTSHAHRPVALAKRSLGLVRKRQRARDSSVVSERAGPSTPLLAPLAPSDPSTPSPMYANPAQRLPPPSSGPMLGVIGPPPGYAAPNTSPPAGLAAPPDYRRSVEVDNRKTRFPPYRRSDEVSSNGYYSPSPMLHPRPSQANVALARSPSSIPHSVDELL